MPSVFLDTIDGSSVFDVAEASKHPINDPLYPSYLEPSLRPILEDLDFIADMVRGKRGWIGYDNQPTNVTKLNRYLPRFEGESDADYVTRYRLTPWIGFIDELIQQFPGFISSLNFAPTLFSGLRNCLSDIDLKGTDVQAFFLEADALLIKDETCFILVDMETNSGGAALFTEDFSGFPLRPYLRLVAREDLIYWELDRINNPALVRIREGYTTQLDGQGRQIKNHITVYRELRSDGSYSLKTLYYRSRGDRETQKLSVLTLAQGQNSIKKLPLAVYTTSPLAPFTCTPKLRHVAELQLEYYHQLSEFRVAQHKTNFPIPVRSGYTRAGFQGAVGSPVRVGVSAGIDLPEGGSYTYVSPPTEWAGVDFQFMEKIREESDRESLKFLRISQAQPKTATEINLHKTLVEVDLNPVLWQKQSTLNRIEELWASYYNQRVVYTLDDSDPIRNSNFMISYADLAPDAPTQPLRNPVEAIQEA